ncbi:MAG: hypothetical protein ACYTJ0_05085 [Planctomycetota bacterium]|jgi:hypothetical protein
MQLRRSTLCTLVVIVLAGAASPALACPDTNGDGIVDVDDALNVIFDWGTDGSEHNGDVDGSGNVDVEDLVAVFVDFGPVAMPCATVPPNVLAVRFWHDDAVGFGELGRPQRQVNVLGNVLAAHGLESLSWSVAGGPELPLSYGPYQRRLAREGDFNIELFYDEMPVGSTEVSVRAVDALGHEVIETITVEIHPQATWPLPYSIDWSSVSDVEHVVDVTDGQWELTPDGLRCTVPDYDRLAVLGDATWQDYEMTVPVTVHAVDEGGYEWPSLVPAVGIVFRWTGHTDLFNRGAQPNQGWWPLGSAFEQVFRLSGCGKRMELYGNPFVLRAEDSACEHPMELDRTYIWKMKVRTTPPSRTPGSSTCSRDSTSRASAASACSPTTLTSPSATSWWCRSTRR